MTTPFDEISKKYEARMAAMHAEHEAAQAKMDAQFRRELRWIFGVIGAVWVLLLAAKLYTTHVDAAQQRAWCAAHNNADIQCSAYVTSP